MDRGVRRRSRPFAAGGPDHAAIGALAEATDSLGLCVFARSPSPDYELVVRAFPAGVGIVEDPASGAANGLIAAWIAKAEPSGALAHGYRVSQGREIGHDAAILIRIEQQQVWVGGKTRTIVRGRLQLARMSDAELRLCRRRRSR